MTAEDFEVVLTPRTFQMTNDDWHIAVKAPDGREIWDSSPYRWTARLKARRIVRGIQRGRYEDRRSPEKFVVR